MVENDCEKGQENLLHLPYFECMTFLQSSLFWPPALDLGVFHSALACLCIDSWGVLRHVDELIKGSIWQRVKGLTWRRHWLLGDPDSPNCRMSQPWTRWAFWGGHRR